MSTIEIENQDGLVKVRDSSHTYPYGRLGKLEKRILNWMSDVLFDLGGNEIEVSLRDLASVMIDENEIMVDPEKEHERIKRTITAAVRGLERKGYITVTRKVDKVGRSLPNVYRVVRPTTPAKKPRQERA